MSENLPAKPGSDFDRALIESIAIDIGKEVVAYVERMYPAAIHATATTFPRSLRNCIANEILAALNTNDPDEMRLRLARRKAERRRLRAMIKAARRMRPGDPLPVEFFDGAEAGVGATVEAAP